MAKGRKTGGGSRKGVPNKATADVRALAQEYGEEAVASLAAIMRNGELPPAARVSAAKELLDRGYGKSKESVDLSGHIAMPAIPVIQIVRGPDADASD